MWKEFIGKTIKEVYHDTDLDNESLTFYFTDGSAKIIYPTRNSSFESSSVVSDRNKP